MRWRSTGRGGGFRGRVMVVSKRKSKGGEGDRCAQVLGGVV